MHTGPGVTEDLALLEPSFEIPKAISQRFCKDSAEQKGNTTVAQLWVLAPVCFPSNLSFSLFFLCPLILIWEMIENVALDLQNDFMAYINLYIWNAA